MPGQSGQVGCGQPAMFPIPAQAGRGPRRAWGGRLQELDKGCGGCGRGAGSGLPKESRGRSRGLRVGSS